MYHCFIPSPTSPPDHWGELGHEPQPEIGDNQSPFLHQSSKKMSPLISSFHPIWVKHWTQKCFQFLDVLM